MRTILELIFVALFTLAATSGPTRANPLPADLERLTWAWDDQWTINDGWHYLEDARDDLPPADVTSWTPVDLPHTWNAEDTLLAKDYRRSASWYRRDLTLSLDDLEHRLYLRFGAAGRRAWVYVNGAPIGEHIGGYAAFTFEITDHVRTGTNTVHVRVSNEWDALIPPLDIDHNIYGGLYRSVRLIRGPRVGIARDERGGPGFRITTSNVSAESAEVSARVVLTSTREEATPLRVTAELHDPTGRPVSFSEVRTSVDSSRSVAEINLPTVTSPILWSPESPVLYTLHLTVWDERRVLDRARSPIGFRWWKFTASDGFFLNGWPYEIRGVNRHQDLRGYGNAVPPEHHLRDIRLIKEVGANAIRLAHYQQDDLVLALCDRLGLLVWEEVPLVNEITDDERFYTNTKNMLIDLVEQHHNHPSVIIWGLQNEFTLRQRELYPQKLELLKEMNGIVRTLDPHRTTAAACDAHESYGANGLNGVADIVGYNMYSGWYYDKDNFGALIGRLGRYRALAPDRPHTISEWGAGSDIRVHREQPRDFDFSEEWQCVMVESYLDQFEATPWLAGTWLWNMFDFGASHRGDTMPGVNQKGVVTFDRTVRKDAFYALKARWSDEPVLYLASPRFTERTGEPTKTYRVYSNFDSVELFHNGRSLGVQREGFRWPVTLRPGQNRLEAVGRRGGLTDRHGFTVRFTK